MLETGFGLLLQALIRNKLLPMVVGVLTMRLFFGTKFQGLKLYIISRFLGVGVIANRMFDLQFLHFGVGVVEYLGLLLVLIIGLCIRVYTGGLNWSSLFATLKIEKISGIKESYNGLSKWERILTLGGFVFLVWFFVNSFVHNISFPTYADDSFGNRHKPATNIYYDGGVKIFGEEKEIMGRGRLGYPIHIPIYKATLADFMGNWYDTYANLFQWLGLWYIVVLSFVFTFEKSKNVFTSIIPGVLLCGMPLVFWHAIDGYQELPSVYYAILSIRFLYQFLETEQASDFVLGSFFLRFLSYMKNDGFVIYMPGIVIVFVLVALIKKQVPALRKAIWNKISLTQIISGIVIFLVPFLAIKQIYNLGFNQAQGAASGTGIDTGNAHREIFSVFKAMFFMENNYSIILVIVGIFLRMGYKLIDRKKPEWNSAFLIISPIVIFVLLTLAFLLTENYKFVMDQTTVNRTYTAAFMILCFFFGICYELYNATNTVSKNK